MDSFLDEDFRPAPQEIHFRLNNFEWCSEGKEPEVKERTAAGRAVVINHGQHVKYRLELVGQSKKDFPQEDFKNWQKSIFFMGRNGEKDKCEIKHDATGYTVQFKRKDKHGYTVIRKDGDQTFPLKMTWYTLDGSQGIEINAILTKSHSNCSKTKKLPTIPTTPLEMTLDPDDTLFLSKKNLIVDDTIKCNKLITEHLCCSSDERLKTILSPLHANMLPLLRTLEPYVYRWNDGNLRENRGLMTT